ncbi:MAG: zinc ribbon domain-containing protein [Deltaproteobacteria bacterium]|nr:zinc ribbon domain-containing protein [Deltaproteobacteria bacterium]
MPIFEFRCMKCGHVFERLFLSSDEKIDMACPKCQSDTFERVVSRSSHTLGYGPGENKPKITTKSCGPSNQCMTIDIPGPAK